MKTTIEEINGQLYTVVRHKHGHEIDDGVLIKNYDGSCNQYFGDWAIPKHIATALPALPKRPKPEDAQLLYRYMAEGLHLMGWNAGIQITSICNPMPDLNYNNFTITHATDSEGNDVDVAIKESE